MSNRKTKGRADHHDIILGAQVRTWRRKLKMTQQDLGACVGISFQQIQKYEAGINRISAIRLWQFSRIFDVPVDYFFREID